MKTEVKLSELEQAKVLFPEEIEELKEDFKIMSLHLTLGHMKVIRPLFSKMVGLIDFIMSMNETELDYCSKNLSQIFLSLIKAKRSLRLSREEIKRGCMEEEE